MNVYIITSGTWINAVFAELADAKAHVLNVYGSTAVDQGAGVWAARLDDGNIMWIRRYPVRGGR